MSRDGDRWKLYVLLRSNFSSATISNEMFLDFAILAKCCTNQHTVNVTNDGQDIMPSL